MKSLKYIFVVYFAVTWLLLVLFTWFFQSLIGKADGFSFTLISGTFFQALIFSGGMFASTYFFLKSKLKFLNSNDTNVPPFGNKVVKTFAVERPDFHFEVVKYKLKEMYEITVYDDTEQHLVKFHSKLYHFSSGQMCGMLTYDAAAKTATVTCFPIQGYTEKAAKETQTAVDKIESLIVNK